MKELIPGAEADSIAAPTPLVLATVAPAPVPPDQQPNCVEPEARGAGTLSIAAVLNARIGSGQRKENEHVIRLLESKYVGKLNGSTG